MLLTILIVVGVVLLDFVTKYCAYNYLAPVGDVEFLPGVLDFTYVTNRGAAGGILADHRWIFMVFSVLAIIAIFFYFIKWKPKSLLVKISLSLILGGGIGNMIDRTFLGYVIDFIYTPWIPWFRFSTSPFSIQLVNFPVYNIADCCVTIGAFLLCFYLIKDTIREEKEKKRKAIEEEQEKTEKTDDDGEL